MRLMFSLFVSALLGAAQPAAAQHATAPSGSSPRLQFLEQRLAATAAENPGEFGMAAMDLSTGEMVSYNGRSPFPMASVVKVAVAATYLSQVDAGRRTMADVSATGASAAQLMERMLIHSDNNATDQLFAMLGGPRTVDAWVRSHNLAGIRVDRTIAQLLAATRDLRDVRDSATPLAFLRLLQVIDTGRVLSRESRARLLDIMGRCATGANRIRGLLPPGTRVEHKTGTLTGLTDDVAFVTLPDGRRIAMVMFARYGDNRPAVIASAARTIYESFVASGASGGVPAFAPAPPIGRRLPTGRVD